MNLVNDDLFDETHDELDEGSLVELIAMIVAEVQTMPDVFPVEWEEEL